MRLLKSYDFNIEKKIPMVEWPEVVHRFLQDQGLKNEKYFYYFQEPAFDYVRYEYKKTTGSCVKALKDCPALGSIQHFKYDSWDEYRLTNINTPSDCTEEDILPHMNKIHRRYGFSYSYLYYYDIDFFGDVIPCERDIKRVREFCEGSKRQFEPNLFLKDQLRGSGIELQRDFDGKCRLILSVDLLHNGKVMDAAPYYEAMKKLLPGISSRSYLNVYMSEEEKERIVERGSLGEPVLEKCREYLSEQLPSDPKRIQFGYSYSVAPKAKRMAFQYGYSYRGLGSGAWYLDKKTPSGHVLRLMIDSPPSHSDVGFYVEFCGLGFEHRLCTSVQKPTNQEEVDSCLERVMKILSEFEKTMLPELDTVYEVTPDWYSI